MKNIFEKFKDKIFQNVNTSTSKITALIVNITALLTAICAFIVSVKTISESFFNLFKII